MTKGQVFLLCVACLLLSACKKGGCNVVPYVPVNRVPFSPVQYPALAATYGTVTLPGGVAGILVVNTPNGFFAYDRCSTVSPEKQCAVDVSAENPLVAVDPCSGAEYVLLNGSPSKIAECPLRPYTIQQVGSGASAVYYVVN